MTPAPWTWVYEHGLEALYSAVLWLAVFSPLVKWAVNWFNPETPGGNGDKPGPDGRPLHEWLSDPPEPPARARRKP